MLIHVDRAWELHAVANDAPELLPKHVIGRSIWEFISDDATREVWQALFHRVRETGHAIALPLRGDSPGYRRFNKLRIIPARGELLISCMLIREERRPYEPLLDVRAGRDSKLLTMCGWCKRVRVSGHRWLEVEDAREELGLDEAGKLPWLVHGMCEDCREHVYMWYKLHSGVELHSPEH